MVASLQEWCAALEAGVRLGSVTPDALRRAIDRLSEAPPGPIGADVVAGWIGVDARVLEELLHPSTSSPTLATSACQPTLGGPTVPLRPSVPDHLGPYQLLSELGHGGMGVVYRARHTRLGSACAVKVLIAGEHASAEAIARFQREAASVARMGRHPNLIGVTDLGQEGPIAYYAMDLVEGLSLRERLREGTPPPADSARILEKAARAVHFAHQHGVIHRDLKPENIVIRTDGEPLVMDFGLAREVGSSAQISVSGQLLGTPSYMAPEQARGDVHLTDARTDVYALGAVLYEMLAGLPPHLGETPMQKIISILQGEVASPRTFRPDVPRDLETICMKCLEGDPLARYQTAEALADELARFQRGESIHARPPGRLAVAGRRLWRHRRLLVGSVLLVAAVVACVAFVRARQAAALEEWARPRVETALEDLERWDQYPYKRDVVLPTVRGEVDAIVRRLDEVLARHPACAPAWYARGKALRRLRRLREADHDLTEAIRLAPENAQYRLERARVTFEVIPEVNLSFELKPALAEQLGGDWDARIAVTKEDLRIARDAGRLRPWEAEACRAMVPLVDGDWQAAIPILDRAIEATPNEPDLLFLRGLAYLGATRDEATRRKNLPYFRLSAENAQKALEIKQSFYEAALLEGWIQFAISQEEDLPDAERHRVLDEGFNLMVRATRIDPDRQIGFYLLGHAWFWSQRNGHTPHGAEESLARAAEAWEQAARLAPWNEYATTWALSARARLAVGRPDEEAIPTLRELAARYARGHFRQTWAYRHYLEAWANWQLAVRLAWQGQLAGRKGEDASSQQAGPGSQQAGAASQQAGPARAFERAQGEAERAVRENVNDGLYAEMVEGLVRMAEDRAAAVPAAAPVCLRSAAEVAGAVPAERLPAAAERWAAEAYGEWAAAEPGEAAARGCLDHASRAVEAVPADARALAWRGAARHWLGDLGGIGDLERAISLDPTLAPRFSRWIVPPRKE